MIAGVDRLRRPRLHGRVQRNLGCSTDGRRRRRPRAAGQVRHEVSQTAMPLCEMLSVNRNEAFLQRVGTIDGSDISDAHHHVVSLTLQQRAELARRAALDRPELGQQNEGQGKRLDQEWRRLHRYLHTDRILCCPITNARLCPDATNEGMAAKNIQTRT